MNKKLFSAAGLILSVLAGSMFTSCLEGSDEDSQALLQGYYTVEGDASQIILHQDGGGTIIPLMSSFSKPAEFVKNERYILQFSYRMRDISEDGSTVTGAELIAGEVLDVHDPLTKALAEEKHLTDADSLFNMYSFTQAWAYRGYLTTLIKGYYSVKESKGIFPTFNLVYDPEEDIQPNRIRLTVCYNRHTEKDMTNSTLPYEFATSFRLAPLANVVPGSDSIEVTINAQGIEKPRIFKMGRADLLKGNYK